jgi:DNA repair exonuclease SbcCD ATPase subunit
MRLHSIEIENWRAHTKKRIAFNEKTTVIYGPNESGKSTILEALSRGIFDRSKSNASQIQRITPLSAVGSLSSKVLIVFSLNGKKYSIKKSFNHNKGSELSRIENGKKTPIAQDDDADRKLINLLEADVSTGATEPSKWGAFYWLWTPQDNRGLPDKGDTTRYLHLDQKGNAPLVTPLYQLVKSSVNSKYLEYFTEKGNIRKKSPVSTLDNEIEQQKNVLGDLNQKYAQAQAYQTEINEIKNGLTVLNKQIGETKNELEATKSEVNELSSYEKELRNIQMGIRETERNINDAKDAIGQLTEIANRIQELQIKENNATAERSRLEALCDLLQTQLDETDKKIIQQQSNVTEIEALTKDARIQYSIIRYSKELNELREKVENISKIENEIKQLRAKVKTVLVTKKELSVLTKSNIQIAALTQVLTDVGLNVSVSPGKKGALRVDIDGQQIDKAVTEATGTHEVVVYSADFGKVTIYADIEKANEIKMEIERRREEINHAITRDSVSSLEDLKELFNEQDRIIRDLDGLRKQRDYVDKRSLEDIQAEVVEIENKLAVYEKEPRFERAIELNPLDANLGKLITQRESEREEATQELDSLQNERKSKRKELEDNRREEISVRAQTQNVQEKRMGLIRDERSLIAKFGNINLQKKVLKKQEGILSSQKDEEKRVLHKMNELEVPLRRMRALENKLENEELLFRQKTSRNDQLLGSIATDSLQGVYSCISEEESKLEALLDRHKRLGRESKSLMLIKTLLEYEYQEALNSVSEPIKKDVAEYLAYITGNLHEDVDLNDKLIPIRMGQRGIDELSLDFEDGSSGLKEAVNLCVRLAVAKHLSEHDDQSLVLDDPFIHMSKNRSVRMIDLFNRLVNEHDLQIIILTHRETEFTGLDCSMVNIQH